MVDEKTKLEECLEDKKVDTSLIQYNKGYEAAQKSCFEKFKKDKCMNEYIDGYKSGFRDGYQNALNDIKESIGGNVGNVGNVGDLGVEPRFGINWWP